MKPHTKLNSQQEQEQQHSAQEQTQEGTVHEFATADEMLRHDAMRTPVPPTIAHRLQESLEKIETSSRSLWQRLFGS